MIGPIALGYPFALPARSPVMSDRRAKTYRPWNPHSYRQQAHSPDSKLPEGHRVFFLLDVVPQLDLTRFYAPYEAEARGAPPFDPALMVCLLLYAYCVGVYSSRKIARACERNLAFLAIVGDDRPDFRTLSDFRKLHLPAFADVFTAVLRLAKEAGLVQVGTLTTDGTKKPGNASRHKAMSYGYMTKEVERLRAEIEALLRQTQDEDAAEDAVLGSRRGDELPAELQRREQYLATERQRHQACSGTATAAAVPPPAKGAMAAKLRTAVGRALYALRKVLVEPVFGQIKGARGFRRFLLRGLEKVRGEWRLVCLTHNLLKLWRYGCAPGAN